MIDPLLTMSLSVSSNKGVYAILLGSGVSRSASIPTGYEIVLDLIRRLAHLKGQDNEADLLGWYKQTFDADPDYSKILASLTSTPAERRRLLSGYFEPTEEERSTGIKIPTIAHKAIARLVVGGYIRVILTTNFDKLMERALEEIGVTPTVISTADSVDGAEPLSHATCVIVKLHGDYLDSRIKNTEPELSTYDPKLDGLLNRIFDDFGLIVCGWSADWDIALRAAMERCPTRRYPTFWAARSEVSQSAKKLIKLRAAVQVSIKDADSFFFQLAENVQSLADLGQPNSLSAKMAVATLKRYLPDDTNRIRVHDLLMTEVDAILRAMSESPLRELQTDSSEDHFRKIVGVYEKTCHTLSSMLAVAGYWSTNAHEFVWIKCIERLANPDQMAAGFEHLLHLRYYPATLATYAVGIGALAQEKYDALASILTKPISTQLNDKKQPTIVAASAWRVFEHNKASVLFPANQQPSFPVSNHLQVVMRDPLREVLPNDLSFTECFDQFEYILALVHADHYGRMYNSIWGPLGEFGLRRRFGRGRDPMQALTDELAQRKDQHPLLTAGLFQGSLARMTEVKQNVDAQADKSGW
jgi:SIR2-like domain